MSSRNGRGAEARSRGAGTARDRAVLVAVRALARAVDILSVAEPSSGSPRPRGRGVNNPPARGGDANPDVPPDASAPADHMSAGRRRRERRARASARARSSPGTGGAPAQGGTGAAGDGSQLGSVPARPAAGPGSTVDPKVIRDLARVLGAALREQPSPAPGGINRGAQRQQQRQQQQSQHRKNRQPVLPVVQPTQQQPPLPPEAPASQGAAAPRGTAASRDAASRAALVADLAASPDPGRPAPALRPTAAPFPPCAGGTVAVATTRQATPAAPTQLKRHSSPRRGGGGPAGPHSVPDVGQSPPPKRAAPARPLLLPRDVGPGGVHALSGTGAAAAAPAAPGDSETAVGMEGVDEPGSLA